MLTHRYRFIAIFAMTIALTTYFWTQSRYPALNEKAMMAESASIADTISMWPILTINPGDPTYKKIAYTTVNWANDNKKGMTFGVILGALFMTLIQYIRWRKRLPRALSTLYGFLLGSPLGVCVNCAAPVFKGVLQSRQAELAFAMMLSSPTMNVVVLTMVFTLFPFYMAATKVIFTLLIIFAGVPLLSKALGEKHTIKDWQKFSIDQEMIENQQIHVDETVLVGFFYALKDFGKNLFFIFKRTVPLMLVAGILGSIISHLIPLDAMLGSHGYITILLTALIGLILPVPVAFDVILTNALFAAGLSPDLTLILLCSLGIYSAYSFMITWTSASKAWAYSISGLVFALSITIGLLGPWLHSRFYVQANINDYMALKGNFHSQRYDAISDRINSEKVPSQAAPALSGGLYYSNQRVSIQKFTLNKRNHQSGRFTQIEGSTIGLNRGFKYGIRDYPDPFWIGRGTASADYDQDGWIDIAFGSDEGLFLYKNNGTSFHLVPELKHRTKGNRVYAVTFIDWDNNGWLDIFYTTFNRGNYVILNEQGEFSSQAIKIPNMNGILTVSPSFADFNSDGNVDVFNANMALGVISGFRQFGKGRLNSITWNHFPNTQESQLDNLDGESMASIASDINQDGHIDIYVSNDFIVPDRLYYGDGEGNFQEILPNNEQTSELQSPVFSMGVDSADLNNDLNLDLVISGTTSLDRSIINENIDGKDLSSFKTILKQKAQDLEMAQKAKSINRTFESKFCLDNVNDASFRENCNLHVTNPTLVDFNRKKRSLTMADCEIIDDPIHKEDCLLSVMWMIVTNNAQGRDCDEEFSFDEQINEVCHINQRIGKFYDRSQFQGAIPQKDRPIAFLKNNEGTYQKLELNHPKGWTWSMKVADYDNDGFQDIFNVEGAIRTGEFGFNVLLRNNGDNTFTQKQFSWGLDDPMEMYSFTNIDYDNDGDIDIITNSAVGPVKIFRNDLNEKNSIAFLIKNMNKNTHALNAKIIIETIGGIKMIREIKVGGGYQSFDSYRVYFGLGDEDSIKSLTIKIPGKHKMNDIFINKTFEANALYEIKIEDTDEA